MGANTTNLRQYWGTGYVQEIISSNGFVFVAAVVLFNLNKAKEMKEEIRIYLLAGAIMSAGVYARAFFGGKRYTIPQLIALVAVGVAIIFILNETNMAQVYKMSICLVYGLLSPNALNAVFKAGTKAKTRPPINCPTK